MTNGRHSIIDEPVEERRKSGRLLLIFGVAGIVIALAIAGFVAWPYFDGWLRYNNNIVPNEVLEGVADGEDLSALNLDWDALRKKYPHIVAYVFIPGTRIDYPVVQGTDNEFYLYHAADDDLSKVGAIFLDYDNLSSLTDQNVLIYGHNMLDGSMFAGLNDFKKQDFFNEHKSVILATPSMNFRLSPAFTIIADGNEKLRQTSFSDSVEFSDYVLKLYGRAVTKSSIDITKVDQLISLATCSYETSDSRTILCTVAEEAIAPSG